MLVDVAYYVKQANKASYSQTAWHSYRAIVCVYIAGAIVIVPNEM